jgi:hypothetical protein
MIFKLGELQGLVEGINEMAEQRLPVKVAYSLNKTGKKIVHEHMTFEESRMKLAGEHCSRDGEGHLIVKNGQFQFSDENRKIFQEKFAELCNIDVDIEAWPVTIEQLGDAKVSLVTLTKLQKLIVDGGKP